MRVLIVKVSSLGDVLHTLPAVTDAKRAKRDLVFDWVVEESFTEIPAWHTAVDKVIPVAIRRWRKNWIKTWIDGELGEFRRNLKEVHYDLVLDAQGLIKSGIISRMAKGLTIGLSDSTIKEPLATLFYNKVYSVPWTEHAVDRIRELFSRALQYKYDRTQVDYGIDHERIGINPAATRQKQLVFLHGTTWSSKFWPEAYWRELARIATAKGYEVLIPWGSDDERKRAEYIAAGMDRVRILERQNLTGLAQYLVMATGAIAVDTGLGHLAAALSVPTISLYGATNPKLSGTFGERQLHLRSDLACSPCMKKLCHYDGPELTDTVENRVFAVKPPCFTTHKPADVWHRFERLVQNQS
ncbi:MAG: lipopolysaccharide heptosyltransferase I [Pseudohongiellaceae bacterium]